MPSNPTLSWERLRDHFYRNIEGYYLQWSGIDLYEHIISSAPYGGAIAMARNDQQLRVYKGPESRQLSVSIYTGAGALLHKIPWDNGRIRGLGWSKQEHLIVVSENGSARFYTDFDGNFTQFSLGKAAEAHGVVECRFWDEGFVALLSNNTFVSVSRYSPEPNPKMLAASDIINEKGIHSWAIIPPLPQLGQLGQHAEVVASVESTVLAIDTTDVRDKFIEDGPFSMIAVAPSADFIALFTPNGHLWVISSDFHRKLSDYDTKNKTQPRQLTWCGSDAVALVYDDEILLVGPHGGTLNVFTDGPVIAIPEIDGIRTISEEKHDFFTMVPDVTVNIFKIGSVSPSAILVDAVEQLDRNSPKADENLQIIGSAELPTAVNTCIEAAGYEFEPLWQKTLLRAAAFGKSTIELYNSDAYVEMAEHLRVLNTIRQVSVGLLMSHQQLLSLSPACLIDRLLLRKMHLLAFRCAEYLKLPKEKIYIHWACCKVRSSNEDDLTVCREIVARLSLQAGISYEEIARVAYDEGRQKLATMLTHYEPRPARQVPLLLSMNEQDLALDKAIESWNLNLVIYVLLHLQQRLSVAAFFRLLSDKPMAASVFAYLCKATNSKLLTDFYYQDDRRYENAMRTLRQAYLTYNSSGEGDADQQLEDFKEAEKLFQELGKDRSFEIKIVAEQIKLLKLQLVLEKEYDQVFVGKSVSETISALVMIAQHSRASKVRDEFKVPDKRFWWIKLNALVRRRDWDELLKFARSRKTSPIGFEPFFEMTLKAGNKRNASYYVPMCTNLPYKKRIEMYVKVDAIRQAAQEATKAKDMQELVQLEQITTSAVKSEIQDLIAQMKK